jgi:hypothetical protein
MITKRTTYILLTVSSLSISIYGLLCTATGRTLLQKTLGMMKLSKNGLALLKQWEGCKLTAYKCTAGVWTIGYGTDTRGAM